MQVLLEFYDVVTRTLKPELSPREAQREVRAFLPWSPIEVMSVPPFRGRFDYAA